VVRSRPPAPIPGANSSHSVARLHRRIFHLTAGSTFPTVYLFVDKELVLPAAIATACAAIILELIRKYSHGFNEKFLALVAPLTKASETQSVLGSTWMLIGTAISIGLLEQPLAILALYYLSLGDPSAALVGERHGRHKIGPKSLEGSVIFLIVSITIGSVLLVTKLETPYTIMIIGAVAAAITELTPTLGSASGNVDDNLKIPLVAGALMELASQWLV